MAGAQPARRPGAPKPQSCAGPVTPGRAPGTQARMVRCSPRCCAAAPAPRACCSTSRRRARPPLPRAALRAAPATRLMPYSGAARLLPRLEASTARPGCRAPLLLPYPTLPSAARCGRRWWSARARSGARSTRHCCRAQSSAPATSLSQARPGRSRATRCRARPGVAGSRRLRAVARAPGCCRLAARGPRGSASGARPPRGRHHTAGPRRRRVRVQAYLPRLGRREHREDSARGAAGGRREESDAADCRGSRPCQAGLLAGPARGAVRL